MNTKCYKYINKRNAFYLSISNLDINTSNINIITNIKCSAYRKVNKNANTVTVYDNNIHMTHRTYNIKLIKYIKMMIIHN